MPQPLSLPQPSTTTLAKAPLQLVVCQVRHDRTLAVSDATRILEVRDRLQKELGESYGLEQQAEQEITVAVGPGLGPVPMQGSAEQRGWRLKTADGSWVVALLPDFFALECTGYTSWSDFFRRLRVLAEAVSKFLGPSVELRLGLRYVDRIAEPTVQSPQEWRGYIDEHLLGPALHADFGGSLIATQQLLQLAADDGMQVLLRHGVQADNSGYWPYVLDTDCFRGDSRRLTAESVLEGAQQLHRLAVQVFQASVTPDLLKLLESDTG